MEEPIKLSILLLVYNVEKYVAQALDSILEQEVDFNYEILVGDDCATDGTRKIVEEYQKQYPEKIALHFSDTNRGNAYNFVSLHRRSRGRYFTVLDGDDYWIDRTKLQKQIDFLDDNPDFTVCAHNSYLLDGGRNGEMEKIYEYNEDGHKYPLVCEDFSDLVLGGYCPYMHTSSLIYRRDPEKDLDFEQWKKPYYRGDLIRTLYYGEKGKVKYMDEVMSVYRLHGDGIFTRLSKIEREIRHIEFFLYHKKYTFNNKYNAAFNQIALRQYGELGKPANDYFLTRAKYGFLKNYLKYKVDKASCSKWKAQISKIIFKAMGIFVSDVKWK